MHDDLKEADHSLPIWNLTAAQVTMSAALTHVEGAALQQDAAAGAQASSVDQVCTAHRQHGWLSMTAL